MTFAILLELERQSCKHIYALRAKYGYTSPFVIALIQYNIVEKSSNRQLLMKAIQKLTEQQAPFDISLTHPYRTYSSLRFAVKYNMVSNDCAKLREQCLFMLGDAEVFQASRYAGCLGKVVSLRQELSKNAANHQPPNVSIRSRLESDAEANRILREVKKINP